MRMVISASLTGSTICTASKLWSSVRFLTSLFSTEKLWYSVMSISLPNMVGARGGRCGHSRSAPSGGSALRILDVLDVERDSVLVGVHDALAEDVGEVVGLQAHGVLLAGLLRREVVDAHALLVEDGRQHAGGV